MTSKVFVVGKNGISAEVVTHSVSEAGKEIITFNIKYGLIVHAEFLRHRLISNSVKSNRAIPMKVIRKEVREDPYVPVWFGAAQKGMVADKEVKNKSLARNIWLAARYPAMFCHWLAEKAGAHKEWANRLLNPWQFVRETVTATEWDNFYALRLHEAAQKDIQELARVMGQAQELSTPQQLSEGEWHVPYVPTDRYEPTGELLYFENSTMERTISYRQAIMASVARCARSSYDNHDKSFPTLEKDVELYDMLITTKPTHGSPAEHVATPTLDVKEWETAYLHGVTHYGVDGRIWSGNLVGWIQHRQQLDGHTVWGEVE